MSASMANKDFIKAAFVDKEAHRILGNAMARSLLYSATRPGFMRTMMFHQNKHWVPEFTARELILYKRVMRHHGAKKASERVIIRQLRGLDVTEVRIADAERIEWNHQAREAEIDEMMAARWNPK